MDLSSWVKQVKSRTIIYLKGHLKYWTSDNEGWSLLRWNTKEMIFTYCLEKVSGYGTGSGGD